MKKLVLCAFLFLSLITTVNAENILDKFERHGAWFSTVEGKPVEGLPYPTIMAFAQEKEAGGNMVAFIIKCTSEDSLYFLMKFPEGILNEPPGVLSSQFSFDNGSPFEVDAISIKDDLAILPKVNGNPLLLEILKHKKLTVTIPMQSGGIIVRSFDIREAEKASEGIRNNCNWK